MHRRKFLKTGLAGMSVATISPFLSQARATSVLGDALSPVADLGSAGRQTWLGRAFWANRLQDWQLNDGRIECRMGDKGFEVRTVSLLTRGLNNTVSSARISARTGLLTRGKDGFCGFLIGVGSGKLDYRGAALAQRAGGKGGGYLLTMDQDGELAIRDFGNDENALTFTKIARSRSGLAGISGGKGIQLECLIEPASDGLFTITLMARNPACGRVYNEAILGKVPGELLQGGISLVSSPPSGEAGARWWFSDIQTGGGKIDADDGRGIGPVMGCMHSLNRNVLKLSAQFMPIDTKVHSHARLDYREAGSGNWISGPTEVIGDGFTAIFRLDSWDATRSHDYRIVFPGQDIALFDGQIVADPGTSRPLKIALYSCILPTSRGLDNEAYPKNIPEERQLERYTPDNILFPHTKLTSHCDSHDPDFYVFCGDQYYETYPTRPGRHTKDGKLDTLYRWYLWYWTYRESIRSRPCVMLADDHDILQGNLWGNAGLASELPKEEDGGFKWDKGLIRMVYRIQHGHNPDPDDPTPIHHAIPVSYCEWVYGGTSFALVEDRKFKSPPDYKADKLRTTGELLGARQEAFLDAWAERETDKPKVIIAASMWSNCQTGPDGKPLVDYDANGYPADGRTRAVKLAKKAGALVICGDQHLGMVTRQGIDDYDDGGLFFAGPAAAAFWQRWFEGFGQLEAQRNGDPNTGNFVDSFGNKMRVLAVANPKITHADFQDDNATWGKFVADHRLKSEGFGLVNVDHRNREFVMECREWHNNRQFDGWPVIAGFDEV